MTKINRTAIRNTRRAASLFLLFAFVLGAIVPTDAQTRRRRPRRRITVGVRTYAVPTNQTMRVRMNENLTSENARVGDTFTATVTDPVYTQGVEVIPTGSIVRGVVTSVTRASRNKNGVIAVRFNRLTTFPQSSNARSYLISGSLTDLQTAETGLLGSGGSRSDSEGVVRGGSTTRKKVVFIGGGAVGGALIGAIAGGGKGAGIGALIGAGLGTAGALLDKGKEAEVKRGTEFGVILNRPVYLPATSINTPPTPQE